VNLFKAFQIGNLFIFLVIFILCGCEFLSREDVVGELKVPEHNILIQGKLGNTISDPLYIRAYANGNLFFQYRMADKVKFAYEKGTLTVLSNCNLEYEYDRIQKKSIKGLKILYKNFK